jgi:hypothetical protein
LGERRGIDESRLAPLAQPQEQAVGLGHDLLDEFLTGFDRESAKREIGLL